MAGSVNKVILIGRLGNDPEVRTAGNGTKIVSFSVATSDRWTDKHSGERQERTEWHRVVVFNEQLAGIAEKYLSKGSMIHLEGALKTRKWTDTGGVDRYSTEVVLAQYRGELTMLGDARGSSDEGRTTQRRREPAMAGAGTGGGLGSCSDPRSSVLPREIIGVSCPQSVRLEDASCPDYVRLSPRRIETGARSSASAHKA